MGVWYGVGCVVVCGGGYVGWWRVCGGVWRRYVGRVYGMVEGRYMESMWDGGGCVEEVCGRGCGEGVWRRVCGTVKTRMAHLRFLLKPTLCPSQKSP